MASNGRGEMIQNDPLHSSSIQKRSVQSRHQKGKNHSRPGKRSTPVDSPPDDKPADLEALRKARLDYIDIPADERKQKMKYVGETIIREPATKADIQHVHRTSEPKRRRQVNDRTGKRRQHRTRVAESDTSRYQSVYQRHRLEDDVEPRRIDEEDDTDEGDQNGADAKGPSEPTQRTKRRRSKTGGHAQGTSEQSVPVEKRRHTSRRRQSEPIDRTRVVRGNSYDNECQPVSRER